MSEIRYNPLEDSYVILAPERLKRPTRLAWERERASAGCCPFCEGNESMTREEIDAIRPEGSLPNTIGWSTRVVPNLYKAVAIEVALEHQEEGLYHRYTGFGAHEVIIDTPKHLTQMDEWSLETFVDWLSTLQKRIQDLRRDVRIVSISLFKNQGVEAGATQDHSHTQLIGLPIIPTALVAYYQRQHTYYQTHQRALLADIVDQEIQAQERLVMVEGEFVVWCPYASAYPFEVMLCVVEESGGLEAFTPTSLQRLATVMQRLLRGMRQILGCFDLNLSIAVPPLQKVAQSEAFFDGLAQSSRFSLQIRPRMARHGGFEVSTGMMVNTVSPEESARLLREVL